ncbi:MAG: cytochrome P450 family protein [Actinomadura sp.]
MTTTPPDQTSGTEMVDMGDEQLMLDPYTGYSQIREQAPLVRAVMPGVDPVWLATRYDDIKQVLSDPRFVVNSANVPDMEVPSLRLQLLRGPHAVPPEYVKYRNEHMGAHDGAENIRLRTLVSPSFTRHKMSKLRPRISEITEELLDRLPGHADENGVVDLLRHFAYALPGLVLCELVGIPEEDREQWDEWYTATWSVTSKNKAEGWRNLVPYVQSLIERYRAEPAENLTSGLIRAQTEDGDRLNDTEMIALIVSIGLAGKQTTADLISSGTVALLEHPDQLTLLRENPELMPRAIHELLRYLTPTHVARMRYATEDIEIGGVLVRKGEAVRPALVAGNYDPRKFDEPDRLDITRAPEGRLENHVSFSHGAHYCLGAALARLEGEVAFEALLRRFPGLTLAIDPADLEYELMPGQWRILTALPVRL